MTDIKTIASETEQVVEGIMKIEPTVATIASMFVPGAAPIVAVVQPMVMMAAPYVEQALKELAAGNNGNVMEAFIQLLQHLSPAHPNSQLLKPAPAPAPFPPPTGIGTGG